MLVVETIGRIRREYFVQGKSIKEIARDLRLSRNTVRKVLRSDQTSFSYERQVQPRPKLGRWKEQLDRLLAANVEAPARERLTLIRIFEELRALGYDGGCDAIRRYARSWAKANAKRDGGCLCAADIRAGRGLSIRLELRDRCDGRGDDDREGRASPPLPQPDDVRARLSERDPGDGVRSARPGVRLPQRRLWAWRLRQHEDRTGDDLRR